MRRNTRSSVIQLKHSEEFLRQDYNTVTPESTEETRILHSPGMMLRAIKSWLIKHAVPLFNPAAFDQLAAIPTALPSHPIPSTPWISREQDSSGIRLPQIIAQRGYRARYPENTLLALRAALEQTQTSALETDLRMTKDGIIVLSHDGSLRRVFGKRGGSTKVSGSTYNSLTHLRTVRISAESLARLDELLAYLTLPGTRPDIWVMLDIKLHTDMRLMMSRIAETIASVSPHSQRQWKDRLVLGIWSETCLPLCTELLPGFHMAHIGVSVDYARRFLRPGKAYENISFNTLTEAMILEPGFIAEAKEMGRPVVVWNALRENWLEWCIGAGLDGVITDDPKRFDDIKIAWAGSRRGQQVGIERRRPRGFGWNLHDLILKVIMGIFNTALRWRA